MSDTPAVPAAAALLPTADDNAAPLGGGPADTATGPGSGGCDLIPGRPQKSCRRCGGGDILGFVMDSPPRNHRRDPRTAAGSTEPPPRPWPEMERAAGPQGPLPRLKIAFIGTHGVGKTTLSFELAARLKRLDYSVDLVKEVARSCPLPLNQETTLDAQTWILYTQVAREIESARDHQALVCDRSVLDNYAYLVEKFGPQEPLESVVRRWLPTYSLMVRVPVLEEPRYDGVRDTDLLYQHRIDRTIDRLSDSFAVAALRLDPSEREGWIESVLDRLPRSPQLPLFGDSVGD